MGWDSGVHAHVEGMSKGIGCTSKKWIRLENVGFPQPPPEMEPVQLGGTETTPNPKRGVASVMGGGWREIFPCSNQRLCVLLMAEHWEEMSGGGAPVLLLLSG